MFYICGLISLLCHSCVVSVSYCVRYPTFAICQLFNKPMIDWLIDWPVKSLFCFQFTAWMLGIFLRQSARQAYADSIELFRVILLAMPWWPNPILSNIRAFSWCFWLSAWRKIWPTSLQAYYDRGDVLRYGATKICMQMTFVMLNAMPISTNGCFFILSIVIFFL